MLLANRLKEKNTKMKLLPLLFILSVATGFAQSPEKEWNINSGLALDGYDPVAYFTQKKAVKGKSSIVTIYHGITYRFASEEHKNIFVASPTDYLPQYGGWCAYAMAYSGEKVEVDPETFTISDGKLYLFYNKFFNNTLDSWKKDEANYIVKADRNWKKTE